MAKAIYTLELPIYVKLETKVRNFLHIVENPASTGSLSGTYWKGFVNLSYFDGEKTHKVSFTPVDKDSNLSEADLLKLKKNISIFMSKLNSSMSLIGTEGCEIHIDLVEGLTEEVKGTYGNEIKSLVVVSIIANSTAAELALNSFFTVIEKSSLNFG